MSRSGLRTAVVLLVLVVVLTAGALSVVSAVSLSLRLSGAPAGVLPVAGSGAVAGAAVIDRPRARPEQFEHRPRPDPTVRVELAFTGDMLLHGDVTATGLSSGFGPMLDPVADVVSRADLALCHLEVPLSRDGTDLSGYPLFHGPPQLADAIAGAGYDGCSTASNHSIDRGPVGVVSTLDVLDAAGLGHTGTARSGAEDESARIYRANGVRVGHVSATYGLNGLVVPEDQPWLVDLVEPLDGLLAEAAATRAAGADIVVVSMHWGAEYRTEPTATQRAQATALLDSPDVDLVVGHHAHVVQPVERVGDKAVVYGLGNFLSGQNGRFDPGTQDGVVMTVTMAVTGDDAVVERVAMTPTLVEPRTFRVVPVERALADPRLDPQRRAQLQASLDRTTARVGPAAELVP